MRADIDEQEYYLLLAALHFLQYRLKLVLAGIATLTTEELACLDSLDNLKVAKNDLRSR